MFFEKTCPNDRRIGGRQSGSRYRSKPFHPKWAARKSIIRQVYDQPSEVIHHMFVKNTLDLWYILDIMPTSQKNGNIDRMKKLFCSLLLASSFVHAQDYYPRVVVLDPLEKQFEDMFTKDIRQFQITQITTPEYDEVILHDIKAQKKQENEVLMQYKSYLFSKEMNYFSRISLGISEFLIYKFYGFDSNCLVFPVHDTSEGGLENYKSLSDKYEVDWLINPLLVKTYEREDEIYTDIRVQLYSRNENILVFDETFTGSSENPGLEWSCEDGSVICTVNNAQAQAIEKLLLHIK